MKKAFACLLLFFAFLPAFSQTFTLTSPSFKKGDYFRTSGIYFGLGNATLLPESDPLLDSVAAFLQKHPKVEIGINSYVDSRGDAEANQRLTVQRAQSVMNYLISKGISSGRLAAAGHGESDPVYSDKELSSQPKCEPGKEKKKTNRRIEFKITAL